MAIQRYQRSGIRYSDMPSIDPIAAREAARTGQVLSQSMDRVSRFAFAAAEKQYRREAKIEGAQMVEDLGAVGALKQIAEKGGPQDLIDDTAYAVANRIAANEIETDARVTIQKLLTDAELGNISYSEFETQLADVQLGYPAALSDLDPEAAAITKVKIDGVAATALTSYSETFQKRQIKDAQGRALMGIDQRLKDISAAAVSDSEVRTELLEQEMLSLEAYMRDYDFSEEFISKTLIGAREQAVTDQVITDFNNIDSIADKQAFLADLQENPPKELGVEAARTLRRSLKAELGSAISARNSQITELGKRIDSRILDVVEASGDPGDEVVYNLGIEVMKTGDAGLKQEYDEAVAIRSQMMALRKMPPDMLQEEINEMRTEGISTPFEARMVESAEKLLSSMRTEVSKDPLSYGIKAGIISATPIDYTSMEGMARSLEQRIDDARKVANHYGVTPRFLTDDEADRLSTAIDEVQTPAEKAQFAVNLNNMPPEIWEQLAEKGNETFAIVSAIGDPTLGRLVFQGETLIEQGLVKMPTKAEAAAVVQDYMSNVYEGEDLTAVIKAANAHYAATTSDRAAYDVDDFEASLKAVTGGIGESNGMKYQLPRGVDQEVFGNFIEKFSARMVTKYGGVAGELTPDQAAERIQESQFKSVGNGRWVVMNSGVPIMRKDGEPFIVTWDKDAQTEANILSGIVVE